MKYVTYEKDRLTLGDALALDRTQLANERTFLAYLRAAMMMGVSAVSLLKLFPGEAAFVAFAWTLIPASVALAILGIVRSVRLARALSGLQRNAESVAGSDENLPNQERANAHLPDSGSTST